MIHRRSNRASEAGPERVAFLGMFVALLAVLFGLQTADLAARQQAVSPAALATAWQSEKLIASPPALLDHETVAAAVDRLARQAPDLFTTEEIGRVGRGAFDPAHLSFGRGPFHVLLWSQMHGDEPTATAGAARRPRVRRGGTATTRPSRSCSTR